MFARGPGMGAGGIGLGTMVVLGIIGWALGINPRLLIGGARNDRQHAAAARESCVRSAPRMQPSRRTDQMGHFVSKVRGSNEDVWSEVLPGRRAYPLQAPRLVLFDGVTVPRCGTAQSAMGPFYCPLDQRIYLDTSFFRDMQRASAAAATSPTPM